MNNTTDNVFSIKDLENISGVKAHTIRIWEKRYNLLQPKRSKTNIRHYDLNNLQKLLNISFLNNNGFKISKIAALDESQLAPKTRELAFMGKSDSQAVVAFKLAMLNFDQSLFYKSLTKSSILEYIFMGSGIFFGSIFRVLYPMSFAFLFVFLRYLFENIFK